MLESGRDLSVSRSAIEIEVREKERVRLDRFLLRQLGWKSRTKIQKLIEVGRVTLNGERPKAASRVGRGDRIVVSIDPGEEREDRRAGVTQPVLYEDAHLVAIAKSPHQLVHPVGRTVSGTVIDELHHRYRRINERGRRPIVPKLCHRLDRETSGLLLIAKSDHARARLSDDFEHGRVRKAYLAVVHGRPSRTRFTVEVPIAPALDRGAPRGHRLARASERGKWAFTEFAVLASHEAISLVLCRPLTGRQNQIRIHLAEAGHPILGDVGYGSSADRVPDRHGAIPFPDRALLHSTGLRFAHPVWGAPLVVEAPWPDDFGPYRALWDESIPLPRPLFPVESSARCDDPPPVT